MFKFYPTKKNSDFFKEYFDVDSIEFYLVNNTETEGDNFETKRQEASDLIRTVVQLRNMVNRFSFRLNELIGFS
jgi:hypothetical protein